MKFIAVGSYTAQGLAGFMKNPKDDRKAVVGGMVAKAGGKVAVGAGWHYVHNQQNSSSYVRSAPASRPTSAKT